MNIRFNKAKQSLALAISTRRKAMHISQEKLALDANIDRTYVSQLEREIANPSLLILSRIAEILECEIKDFL